ncbi:hypothetical protein TNCV_2179351 [Trichonephila clavipes]|uniref:Uncharacterized protein n=1 Tax=Trichonephila clavipes TaxID=2585209 RepID=A0A8X6VUH3_TRICX|nr:hypothetical protein TNCV_2179351 [Trichonephila clavipes]
MLPKELYEENYEAIMQHFALSKRHKLKNKSKIGDICVLRSNRSFIDIMLKIHHPLEQWSLKYAERTPKCTQVDIWEYVYKVVAVSLAFGELTIISTQTRMRTNTLNVKFELFGF